MKTLARFALLIVLILVMPVPAAPALPFKSKVTRQNYEKIHKGMTKAQVEKILGKPTEMKSETGLQHLGEFRQLDLLARRHYGDDRLLERIRLR